MNFAIARADGSQFLRIAIANSIRQKYDEKINCNECRIDNDRYISYLRSRIIIFENRLSNEYSSQNLVSPYKILNWDVLSEIRRNYKRQPLTPVSSPESDEENADKLDKNVCKKKKRKKRKIRTIDLELYQRLLGSKAKSLQDLREIHRPLIFNRGHKLRPIAKSVSERLYVVDRQKMAEKIIPIAKNIKSKQTQRNFPIYDNRKKSCNIGCQTDKIVRRRFVPAMIKDNAFLAFKRRAEEVIRLGSENPSQFTKNQWQNVAYLANRLTNQGYKQMGKKKRFKNHQPSRFDKQDEKKFQMESLSLSCQSNDFSCRENTKENYTSIRQDFQTAVHQDYDNDESLGLIIDVEPLRSSDEENFVNSTEIKEIDADHCDACRQLVEGTYRTRSNYIQPPPPLKELLGITDPKEDEFLRNLDMEGIQI